MKKFGLSIADYRIGFESADNDLSFVVPEKFYGYLDQDQDSEILIKVRKGEYRMPATAVNVFLAPFVEEVDGTLVHGNPDFWNIWKDGAQLFIRTAFPLTGAQKRAVLRFSLTDKEWDLWVDGDDYRLNPVEYPLDGLILYYLTCMKNDIMIHASGINFEGKGYLFSGVSGKGKTTMSRLWKEYGASVIHDDRLIIRKTPGGYRMFNTPVYDSDVPLESSLDEIFLIDHGLENRLEPIRGAAAVSHLMANCIQHAWNTDILSGLLGSVSEMCGIIPTFRLQFYPDMRVIEHIVKRNE